MSGPNEGMALSLLLQSVGKIGARELLDQCVQLGMRERPYIDALGGDQTLPDFDEGYHLTFAPQGSVEALFEILRIEDEILQAGFQCFYRRRLLSSTAKQVSQAIIDAMFMNLGIPQISTTGGIQTWVYADPDDVVAYTSLGKQGAHHIINTRIGNRRYWG